MLASFYKEKTVHNLSWNPFQVILILVLLSRKKDSSLPATKKSLLLVPALPREIFHNCSRNPFRALIVQEERPSPGNTISFFWFSFFPCSRLHLWTKPCASDESASDRLVGARPRHGCSLDRGPGFIDCSQGFSWKINLDA